MHALERLSWILSVPLFVIAAASEPWSILHSGCTTNNSTALLIDAESIIQASSMALLSTHAVVGKVVGAGAIGDINSRVVSPKPLTKVVDASSVAVLYIDTNSLSRKFVEITSAVVSTGAARVNLLFFDRDGAGYVSLRGNATMCDAAEAKHEWWDGWAPFYPEKENSSDYAVIRFVPDWLEVVGGTRGNVQSGRADWLPVSLERRQGKWEVVVPAAPTPTPAPPAPPSPSDQWKCSVCQHVYDAQKDGGGLTFEQLADTWKCPICGAPKSAFKHTSPSAIKPAGEMWTCTVCAHVYDAQKDGGGVPFEQLPATWECPVCGAPKSAYKKTSQVPALELAGETLTCTVCAHVYDVYKDGHGVPFEQLPATWKCPVCGAPKSAYRKTSQEAAIKPPGETWTCTVCQHVYDAQKDGGGLLFEQLADTWKCPVCGSPKSAFKKTLSSLVGAKLIV